MKIETSEEELGLILDLSTTSSSVAICSQTVLNASFLKKVSQIELIRRRRVWKKYYQVH
jgi:hypothetical protein